jgi:Na+/proline symporter
MIDLSSLSLSVEIALATFVAFVIGRVLALPIRSSRAVRIGRGVVIAVSALVALYFYLSPSSRYALLLPAAFAFGFLSRRRRKNTALFERDE